MDNWVITTDGRPLAAVEKQIARYLRWLDVRLFPLSEHRAVLRGPIRQALAHQYPSIPDDAMRAVLGIAAWRSIDGVQSAILLAQRDDVDLPPRRPATRVPAATAAGGLDPQLGSIRIQGAWDALGGRDAIAWGGLLAGQIDTGYLRHPVFGFEAAPRIRTDIAETFFPPPAAPDQPQTADPGPGQGVDSGQGISGGHGTRIGSAIVGHDLATGGPGFFGAAPRLPLVPVRITDIVLISHAQYQFAQAVDHLLAQGVAVVNVSLGTPFAADQAMRRAVDRCYEAGTILVCAAGNIVNEVVSPARFPRAIAVAGVSPDDRPWSGSAFGPEVAFSAPADQIRRAQVKRSTPRGYAGGGDGTSYAAALTSGVAALWLAHHGAAIAAAYPEPWQRIEAFRHVARRSARQPPGWQPDAGFGAGILDAAALLAEPLPASASLHKASTS